MKSAYIERRFKLNNQTTVTVKSKKDKDADIYSNIVTVTRETKETEPLQIHTRKEIEEAVRGIDLDDDQLEMFSG